MENLLSIIYKDRPTVVMGVYLRDIDLTLCSFKFKQKIKDFPPNMKVFIKCHSDGTIDYREKAKGKKEYRIIHLFEIPPLTNPDRDSLQYAKKVKI